MSYIPPHKRHNPKDDNQPSLNPRFNEIPSLTSGHRWSDRNVASNIKYASDTVFHWWPIASSSNNDFIPDSFCLKPIDCEIFETRQGYKQLVLVCCEGLEEKSDEGKNELLPWVLIAERVVNDLMKKVDGARNDLKCGGDDGKLCFIARPGKNVFHGGSSITMDSIRKAASTKPYSPKLLPKTFYTIVPNSYIENVKTSVAPKLGFTFHSEKEYYHIKVVDKCRSNITIVCKCKVSESRQLEIYKMGGNLMRHMVEDISCLDKELDLRLLLTTERKMKFTDNEENEAIKELVRSAIIDPDVRGGLRWPIGKQHAAGRFSLMGVWHAKSVVFKSNTMSLNLRHANRFDFKSSFGEVSNEAYFKLTEIAKILKEGDIETTLLKVKVQEVVKMFWEHLLRCSDLTST